MRAVAAIWNELRGKPAMLADVMPPSVDEGEAAGEVSVVDEEPVSAGLSDDGASLGLFWSFVDEPPGREGTPGVMGSSSSSHSNTPSASSQSNLEKSVSSQHSNSLRSIMDMSVTSQSHWSAGNSMTSSQSQFSRLSSLFMYATSVLSEGWSRRSNLGMAGRLWKRLLYAPSLMAPDSTETSAVAYEAATRRTVKMLASIVLVLLLLGRRRACS
ncbi:hypothetical protein BC831DRAFT_115414 [Entophlyctis helioformis]|nr:hypothetical protein BC831DRAFT_115414 [Entophlyctis helioformis]